MQKPNSFTRRLTRFIIGGTILGITGLSLSRKGRGILGRFFHRLGDLFTGFQDTAKSLGEKLVK